MEYKNQVTQFYKQDQANKDFMQFLERMKNKNFTSKHLVDLEDKRGKNWDQPNALKNLLIEQIGKGEDLLLTHLALKIGE